MNVRRYTVGMTMALGFFAAIAARGVTFLGADSSGSGDLAEPTHWDGGAVPTDQATVFDKPGTLNASAGESFTGISTLSADGTLIFDLLNGVSFQTMQNEQDGARVVVSNGTHLSFGLNFNLAGQKGMKGGARLTVTGAGTELRAPNGASNAGVYQTYGQSNLIEVVDGALLYANECVGVGLGSGPENGYNRLYVGADSTVQIEPSRTWPLTLLVGNESCSNVAEVCGTITNTAGYNQFYVGYGVGGSNNVMIIRDGGLVTMKGVLRIGASGSGNRLIVEKGGTLSHLDNANASSRAIMIGANACSSNNLLRLEEGATLNLLGGLHIGEYGSHNTFELVNPTKLFGNQGYFGCYEGSDHNLYYAHGTSTVDGPNFDNVAGFGLGSHNTFLIEGLTVTNVTTNLRIPNGTDNRIVFKDADISTAGQLASAMNSACGLVVDNTRWRHLKTSHARAYFSDKQHVTIRNNSDVRFVNDSLHFGTSTGAADAGNEFRIESGSLLCASDFRLQHSNNRMTIANAKFQMTNGNSLPYTNGGGYCADTTNNTFRFEGATPVLENTSALRFIEHATDGVVTFGKTILEFELPATPYAAAPLQGPSVSICASTRIHLDIKAYKACKLGISQRFLLAEASTGKVSVSDLEALGSELPERCELSLSSDQKQLWLLVKSNPGLRVIVR